MYDTFSVAVKGVKEPNLLSSLDGSWHDQQRRVINPAFNLSSLLKYEPWVDNTIDLLQHQLSKRVEHQRESNKTVDLHRWLAFFAADVISNLTYGQRTGFLETETDVEGIQATVRAVFRFWIFVGTLRENGVQPYHPADTDQFSQMPILDKWTFKNPLLLWALRHGYLEIKMPLAEIVQRQFDQRKKVWEGNQKNGEGCTTLVDSFLMAGRDNREKIEISPDDLALGMVTAGSEST
jgi:cytochrome P450